MGRSRKRGRDVHGWLVLDKPVGMTSTQAVGKIRRLFDARKAGHAGTLDPLASGLLPIALGEATKTVNFVMDGRKVYSFVVRFGVETDTDDAEGKEIATSDQRPTDAEIADILGEFTGEIMQTPPIFSAIMIDGRRAYDLARDGEDFALEPRPITVHALRFAGRLDADHVRLEAECGKGTYVRALARDIGRRLGSCGHVIELRRLVVGPFGEDDMISLDELDELSHVAAGAEGGLLSALLPIETALDDIPALAIGQQDATRLRNGQAVLLRGQQIPVAHGPAYALCRGELVALGEVERGALHPKRIFKLSGLMPAAR
ncbi:MAG: tRNA pseudouridine(55) synthase TruB [Hyphomicrobiales bacterium]|nr:tRNA pseudouridine(55) synthase TruB [Hyphomicrobiales bacterium]